MEILYPSEQVSLILEAVLKTDDPEDLVYFESHGASSESVARLISAVRANDHSTQAWTRVFEAAKIVDRSIDLKLAQELHHVLPDPPPPSNSD